MRRFFTLAAHSGLAFAPLTSSTVTWASRAVGAVTFGVFELLPPPQAADASTPTRAAARASAEGRRADGRAEPGCPESVRFIGSSASSVFRFVEEPAWRS